MRLQFAEDFAGWSLGKTKLHMEVSGETDQLTDVALCSPTYLAPVPSCSVTCESLRSGHSTSVERAVRQHDALISLLLRHEVNCHDIPPRTGLSDLCFARDIAVTTPWGLVVLNPAKPHRVPEAEHLVGVLQGWCDQPIQRILEGRIEGGDVCIAGPGLLIMGVSGDRTDELGAASFAHRFQDAGWDVIFCRFDPHFLHLDTIFCMLNDRTALICEDAVDDELINELFHRGIETLPVTYKEVRKLGCNVLP